MNHIKSYTLMFGFLVLCAAGFKAEAAPLCVQVSGLPSRCIYADPNECRREANRVGGQCAGNPAEFPLTSVGSAQFCVIESNLAMSCIYPDRQSCMSESTKRGGACITSSPRPYPPLDPYEDKRPYSY